MAQDVRFTISRRGKSQKENRCRLIGRRTFESSLSIMKLTESQRAKFRIAAEILAKSKKETEVYKARSEGIETGDSERKQKAMRDYMALHTEQVKPQRTGSSFLN